MVTTKKPAKAHRIYQFDVSLLDIKPRIWRRLLIPGNLTLAQLNQVIQSAFGWTDSHLHEFTIGADRYGMADIDDMDAEVKDEKKFTVAEVLKDSVSEFEYEYDFGDGWCHRVVVKGIIDATPANDSPQCVAGKNACPPDDVGGPGGYEMFLKSMADPEDDEHSEYLDWYGGPFDPKAFDIDAANALIRRLR
jgi:hypothetical protein